MSWQKLTIQCVFSCLIITLSNGKCYKGFSDVSGCVTLEEEQGYLYMQQVNQNLSREAYKMQIADWNYDTNITEENRRNMTEVRAEYAEFEKEVWREVMEFKWTHFKSRQLKKMFKDMSVLGEAALSEDQLRTMTNLQTEMERIYSTAKVCEKNNPNKCDLALEPELTKIMASSRDYNTLKYYWKSWRDKAGRPMRQDYIDFIRLQNKAARLNKFGDMGKLWIDSYDSSTFTEDIEELWQQVKPLYLQLHAYVRGKLRKFYGEDKLFQTDPIPAHLLGNMWAQQWNNIADLVLPYKSSPVDVTDAMKQQGYTVSRMFHLADDFYASLGLTKMPPEFWEHSMFVKPKTREVVCHASAWDFSNGKDVRIKMCTEVNMEDLITIHHEMGHVEYYLQYRGQPEVFRGGANPGFHEAVGDVMALSVSTPKHLKVVGLLDDVTESTEGDINFLMKTALDKIAFLPFGYLMDKWRWSVFSGETPIDQMNSKWWELREKYQGVSAPVTRTEEDFDPGAKFHIPANVPYVRYFVSFVTQFQFHKALCEKAGQYDPHDPRLPLHRCDIYKSKPAGSLLADVLKLGSSKPWPEAMKILTGEKKMSAEPILEYFRPLQKYLEKANLENKECLGWGYDVSCF